MKHIFQESDVREEIHPGVHIKRFLHHKGRRIALPPEDLDARRVRFRLGLFQHAGGEIQPSDAVTPARQFDGMTSGAAADIQQG